MVYVRGALKSTFQPADGKMGSINPSHLFARINLGVVYEDQKRWKEAGGEYRKILQVTPEDKHMRKRLGRISRPKGKWNGLS